KPAVGAAVMIAEFGFFAPGDGVKDHHSIVRRYTNLRSAIAVEVLNDVQWLEDGVLWRIGLPDEAWRIETFVISKELKPADFLVGPGVSPRDALPTFDIWQDF